MKSLNIVHKETFEQEKTKTVPNIFFDEMNNKNATITFLIVIITLIFSSFILAAIMYDAK